MKSSKNNPETNKLSPGISDEDIELSIIKSGYPLQTIIANKLRANFHCQEEWSFIDSKTKEIRNLDIMAEKDLYNPNEITPKIRPTLNLLIECKQSELPYVFFLSPNDIKSRDYPMISGLNHKEIEISTNDELSTTSYDLGKVLGLNKEISEAPSSMTFSKCARSGKFITLSGTESYQSLLLPLIKSMQYFDESKTPSETASYFDAHLTFGVAVIDGPMIGVFVDNDTHHKELTPWIRVFRHESYKNEGKYEGEKLFAIDIVHKDFFAQFINEYIKPFSIKFSERILKHQDILIKGKAFAKGLGKNWWGDIEGRLEKRSITKTVFSRLKD